MINLKGINDELREQEDPDDVIYLGLSEIVSCLCIA